MFASAKYTEQRTGIPIPPYPLTGETFVQYATSQQEAARTRAYLIHQQNMEEDMFGFARFRQDADPAENQVEVAIRNENDEIERAAPASPSLKSGYSP